MSNIRKVFLIVLGAIFLIVLLVAVVILWLANGIFDKTPLVSYQPHISDIKILNNVLKKLSGNTVDGVDLSALLDPNMNVDVLFNQKEVNELISSGMEYYANLAEETTKRELVKNLRIKFTEGIFMADYSFDSKFKTPFGSYINFRCEFVPEISNGNLSIVVKSIKVGSFATSPNKINKIIKEQIAKEKTKTEVADFLNVVKEVKIEGKDLRVKYNPATMMNLLLKRSGGEIPQWQ